MKHEQLDIFAGGASDRPKAKRQPKKKPSRRRRREVKKAPMLVDAFDPQASSAAKVSEEIVADLGPAEVRPELTPKENPSTEMEDMVDVAKREAAIKEEPHIFTVSEITENIKGLLERNYTDVWVVGEVTDFRNRTGRHFYFALKDTNSRIRAVIFGGGARSLGFELADGMELICHGRINVYEPTGVYSLIVDYCEPKGIGALQLAFEQLKKRLEAEGLFAPERKRPIPFLPHRVGVVTSPAGAAIRDIVHVLTRRFPNTGILLYPVRVQGEGAAQEIAGAIREMSEQEGVDVLIVGRGGGSIEDLWAFNEEVVARAIAACRIPVISAVGHEIDYTIADFVADVRAPTPSAAAEIAVPVRQELSESIGQRRRQLSFALTRLLENRRHGLHSLSGRLADPSRRFPDLSLRIDGLCQRLAYSVNTRMDGWVLQLAKLASNLDHLSPMNILAKGYAVVEGPDGRAVTQARRLSAGDELKVRFHQGRAEAKVTKVVD
jgi:exodeoxyribonuclease VII large subunit